MSPIQQNVIRYIETNGETEAVERAEVRARVRGFIEAIEFEPGQTVARDTLLYQIEDDECQAAVNLAKAEVTAAKAQINVAESQVLTAKAEADRSQRELKRQQTLLSQKATSQSDYDRALAEDEGARAMLNAAQAAVDSAKATLTQAQARLDKAQLDLKYTRVTAPIAGRVTKTDLKLGNLVEVGLELAAVVNDSRMYANFTISDRELLELRAAREEASADRVTQEQWSNVPVQLKRETDDGFPFHGNLNYVDQEGVDSQTGTLGLRAVFDNSQGSLVAGLFVRIRMPVAVQKGATLIPSQAVMQDRIGAFVLTLDEENAVQRQNVQVGKQNSGWSVILDGLSESDSVIIQGVQRARPGATVVPKVETFAAEDLPAEFQAADIPPPGTAKEPPAADAAPANSPPADASRTSDKTGDVTQ